MADTFSPGTKPIIAATMTLCDQDNVSKVITSVSTAINTVIAMRISQERTIDLEKKKERKSTIKVTMGD